MQFIVREARSMAGDNFGRSDWGVALKIERRGRVFSRDSCADVGDRREGGEGGSEGSLRKESCSGGL